MTEGGGTLFGMIESILFVAGEAVEFRDLAKALRVGEEELEKALEKLSEKYSIDMILSISTDKQDIPENLKSSVIISL